MNTRCPHLVHSKTYIETCESPLRKKEVVLSTNSAKDGITPFCLKGFEKCPYYRTVSSDVENMKFCPHCGGRL